MFKLPRGIILTLLVLLLAPITSHAQDSVEEGHHALLAPLEMGSFPQISTYIDVRDAQEGFVFGLEPSNVTILENGDPLPVQELKLMRPGVQLVVAFNPGPAFSIRDVNGLSRFDHLSQTLEDWASARGTTLDDLSLLANEGPEITHQSDPNDWLTALQGYQPDGRELEPNFDIMGRALEIAADESARQGMGRAVLFVTTLPPQELGVGLQSLTARASQRGVRLFVWLVASAEQFSSESASQLETMALQTGGKMFAYSGTEEIPSPDEYLEPLRNTYHLTYTSQITSGDTHRAAAVIETPDFTITTPEREFELAVLPPNVAFVSPPSLIERTSPVENPEEEVKNLTPQSQPMEILVEFPDGFERAIVRTSLYADGQLVDENTASPYEDFTWDLSDYEFSGSHTLKAEVVDSLGLSNTSVDMPVRISIERPTPSLLATVSRNRTVLAGVTVALAGAVLLLVLIVGGRIRPTTGRIFRRARRKKDPVTQPVEMKTEAANQRLPGWINRLHWPQRRPANEVYALLFPIAEDLDQKSSPPIQITTSEVTFGRDPALSTRVIEDPSVEEFHARLLRQEDGSFTLCDQGTTAGTWINYTPVSKEGANLQHGDLIHFGRVGYRFTLRDPEKVRRPVVIPKEPRA